MELATCFYFAAYNKPNAANVVTLSNLLHISINFISIRSCKTSKRDRKFGKQKISKVDLELITYNKRDTDIVSPIAFRLVLLQNQTSSCFDKLFYTSSPKT